MVVLQAKVTNGQGRDSSIISDVRCSTCASWAEALLPAPTSYMPPSLVCCKLSPCCVQPCCSQGEEKGKTQKEKEEKKDSFVTFPFSALWEIETELCHRLVACDSGAGRGVLSRQQSTKGEKEWLQSNTEGDEMSALTVL